jgi:hypothetical protein
LGFYDQHHQKVSLGGDGRGYTGSRIQYRAPQSKGGQYAAGGNLPPKRKFVKVTYPKEARANFGYVATYPKGTAKDDQKSNNRVLRRAPLWDYSGKIMIGPARAKKLMDAELKRIKGMKGKQMEGKTGRYTSQSTHWMSGVDLDLPNPVMVKFGSEGVPPAWESELMKNGTGLKKFARVEDMLMNVMYGMEDMMKETVHEDDWMVWMDALSQLNEEGAHEFLKNMKTRHGKKPYISYYDRLVRSSGTTNQLVATRYVNKLTGDRPNFMPLDHSIFADVLVQQAFAVGSTWTLPLVDANGAKNTNKYSLGTPQDVYSCMERCYFSVDQDRFFHDHDLFRKAIKECIKVKGCKLHDEVTSGRRHRKKINRKGTMAARALNFPEDVKIGIAALREVLMIENPRCEEREEDDEEVDELQDYAGDELAGDEDGC